MDKLTPKLTAYLKGRLDKIDNAIRNEFNKFSIDLKKYFKNRFNKIEEELRQEMKETRNIEHSQLVKYLKSELRKANKRTIYWKAKTRGFEEALYNKSNMEN